MEYFTKEEMEDISRVAKENLFGASGQVNVNHANCSAGEDTKNRLYVRITEDNSKILAYCHHCNRKGVRPLSLLSRIPTSEARVHYWADVTGEDCGIHRYDKWYRAALRYENAEPMGNVMIKMSHAGHRTDFPLSYFPDHQLQALAERDFYGMRYKDGIVIVPRFGEKGLLGIDERAMSGDLTPYGPKWRRTLALAEDDTEVAGKLIIYNTSGSDTAVLVEDPISAMRIDLLGYAAVALTGSSLSSDDAFKLSLLYRRMVVWLDNDSASIIKQAHGAQMRLNMYKFDKVGFATGRTDPKKYHDEEIKLTIEGALK